MTGLGPAQRVMFGILGVAVAAVGFAAGRALLRPSGRVVQPIAFNHQKHIESLECETCHEYVTKSAHSGLPGLSVCLGCHEEPQTDSPEERKIVALAETGAEQVFLKLMHLPDNVFYTHRRHVGIAGIECATCHGAIAQSTRPPETPMVRITMDFCIGCHQEKGVPTDCTRCHR